MTTYKALLFDLDGTLVDSSEGITKSVAYALQKRGYGEYPPDVLRPFIGPPLREQFMSFCKVDTDEGASLVSAYRERYTTKGIFECSLYDGIRELLASLKQHGYTLLVATSKPEKFAKMILEHFGIAELFDFVGGALLDNTRTKKDEVISYVLENACGGIFRDNFSESCLMIGDTAHDVGGAAKIGMKALAVSYGFGEYDELVAAKPIGICNSPEEIGKKLL